MTYILGRGDGEGKAVDAGGGGHEGLGLLRVDRGEEPNHDSLALRLEGLSLIHGGDRLNHERANKKQKRTRQDSGKKKRTKRREGG